MLNGSLVLKTPLYRLTGVAICMFGLQRTTPHTRTTAITHHSTTSLTKTFRMLKSVSSSKGTNSHFSSDGLWVMGLSMPLHSLPIQYTSLFQARMDSCGYTTSISRRYMVECAAILVGFSACAGARMEGML